MRTFTAKYLYLFTRTLQARTPQPNGVLIKPKSLEITCMDQITINKEVTISSVYFKKEDLETFPKQMEFEGEVYTFLNSGWRYIVHRGREIVRIFSVTDGKANYRLKLEPDQQSWTLLNIKPL